MRHWCLWSPAAKVTLKKARCSSIKMRQSMARGDGAEMRAVQALKIRALTDAEVLVVDVPQAAKHNP